MDGLFCGKKHLTAGFWYEEIVGRLPATVGEISKQMGVELMHQPNLAGTFFRKQATQETEEWVERFMEDGGAETVSCLDIVRGVSEPACSAR